MEFESDKSTTYDPSTTDVTITYGKGQVKGHVAEDRVQMVGVPSSYVNLFID